MTTVRSERDGSEERDKRFSPANRHRLQLSILCEGEMPDGSVIWMRIRNLSPSGMLVETDPVLDMGAQFSCELPGVGTVKAEVLWGGDGLAGCRFDQPLSQAQVSALVLRHPAPAAGPQPSISYEFGKRLRMLREQHGLTRAELAARCGTSVPTLWSWETGKTLPRPKRAREVAAALDVDLVQLAGRPVATPVDEFSPASSSRIATGLALPQFITEKKIEIAELAGVEPTQVQISIAF